MVNLGFIFAMDEEIKPFVEAFGWTKFTSFNKTTSYTGFFDKYKILASVSGIGKMNAAIASASQILMKTNLIVNIGTCGSVGQEFKVGDIVVPGRFYDGDWEYFGPNYQNKDPVGVFDKYTGDKVGVDCYSFSKFVEEPVATSPYFVDMEGYAIQAMCSSFNIDFLSVKVVSDNADDDAKIDFQENITKVLQSNVEGIKRVIRERIQYIEERNKKISILREKG